MAEIYWKRDVSGDFSDPRDWVGGVAAAQGDDAILNAAGTPFTVTAIFGLVESIQTSTNATLALGFEDSFTATNGTGTGANAGTIELGKSAVLSVGGALNNTGTIALDGVTGGGALLIIISDTTLSGGGHITLTGTGSGPVSGNEIWAESGTLFNVDDTISGSGLITGRGHALINEAHGVIDANAADYTLRFNGQYTTGPTITNNGLIEGTGAAGLVIDNAVIRTSGGTIFAGAGSNVAIESSSVVDGPLRDALNTASGGAINISAESNVQVQGVQSNGGLITLTASELVVRDAGVTLTGAGTLSMGPDRFGNPALIAGLSAAGVLTNDGNTITGEGAISLNLVNAAGGIIEGGGVNGLTVGGATYSLSNAGLIEATDAGAVTILGAVDNTGTLEANGGTLTMKAAVTGDGQAVIAAGTLDFASGFAGDVTFEGPEGVLELANSQSFTGAVSGLSIDGGTSLDLEDIAFKASDKVRFVDTGGGAGGVLTISDGVYTANVALVGDYVGDWFIAGSDGHGGVNVVAAPGPGSSHWTGAVSDDFATSANWAEGVTPGAFTDAILDATGGGFTVSDATNRSVNSLQTAANATFTITGATFDAIAGTGSGTNAGTITVGNGATFQAGGTIDNSGAIELVSSGTPTELILSSDLVLTGGGVVTLSAGFFNGVEGVTPHDKFTNVNNTITGSGGLSSILNNEAQGVVDADGGTLAIIRFDGMDINAGLMEATGTGLLYIVAPFDNAGGDILAANDASVYLGGATIHGGALSTAGDGLIEVVTSRFGKKTTTLDGVPSAVSVAGVIDVEAGAWLSLTGLIASTGELQAAGGRIALKDADISGGTVASSGAGRVFVYGAGNGLDGVANPLTLAGDVVVISGATLTIEGTIIDTGTLSLTAGSGGATLSIGAPGATLSGGGLLMLSSSALNEVAGAASGAVLTNVNDVIRGAGQLGNGEMALVNDTNGTIEGSVSTALTIDLGANTLVNAGVVENLSTGGLVIDGAVANTGTLNVTKGTLSVDGAVTGAGTVRISGGTADFGSDFTENVAFTTRGGVLHLTKSQTYAGQITGFAKTPISSLDLLDINFGGSTTATFSGTTASGTLTVTDGTHTSKITLLGNYTTSTFTTASDGHGGTTVTDPAKAPAAGPPSALVTAMAGFGGGGAAVAAHSGDSRREPLASLATPRTAAA